MPVQIPLRSDLPRWTQQVVLGDTYDDDGISFTDGALYEFTFDWSGRASTWSFEIRDASNTLLLAGEALRLGTLRLSAFGKASGLPPGDLLLVDLTGTHTEPTLNSLGVDHALLYYTSGELAAVGL